ncbi:MAG: VWA domain-containing protein [Candidatus Xenobia bacterium]
MLDTLLWTPHRNVDEIVRMHGRLVQRDPIFYGHLATWYMREGEVRDHKEVFVATMLTSPLAEHREAGAILLAQLPPYEVARVVDCLKQRIGKVPRSARTAVTRYLRTREQDPVFFDRAVLRARQAIKHLYASLHVKPSARAHAVLFEGRPPADSVLFQVQALAKASTAAEQAAIVRQHRIPFTTAVGALKQVTTEVLVALLESMSAQEVINHLKAIKAHQGSEQPKVRDLVAQRLSEAATADRVSAFKALKAADVARVDQATREKLEQVAHQQVVRKGRITRSTAVLVDKSGSMQQALEVGCEIAALVSSISTADLHVWAFDTRAKEVKPDFGQGWLAKLVSKTPAVSPRLADWKRGFSAFHAGGGTSIGVALEELHRLHRVVEQIVIVTDEGENTKPFFCDVYEHYSQGHRVAPHVVVVKVGAASNHLERQMASHRIPYDAWTFTGDMYSLPNLVPLLARKSRLELLLEILDTPLPARSRLTA